MRHFVSLFFLPLLLTACKDEQRLYTVEGEPGPSVTISEALPAGHPPLEAAGSSGSTMGPPPSDRPLLDSQVELNQSSVAGLAFSWPSSWISEEPASSMRILQLALPDPLDERGDAEVTFFHFGPPPGGGSAEDNISRWVGQVELSEPEVLYQSSADDLTVSEVIAYGTLKPSGMGMGPSEARPESALYGIIVEGGPEGSVFIKATGSRSTIDAAMPALATIATTVTVSE